MKFMLMMNPPAGGDYQIMKWPEQDIKNHMTFMHAINAKLQKNGEFADGQGLSAPSKAKLVKSAPDGHPITDGVFAEAKEFLAGFWIVDVPTAERAHEIAAEISLAPGIGGKPLFMSLEVREVMFVTPKDV
ncbi:YciI family protein [soil metagenome]